MHRSCHPVGGAEALNRFVSRVFHWHIKGPKAQLLSDVNPLCNEQCVLTAGVLGDNVRCAVKNYNILN